MVAKISFAAGIWAVALWVAALPIGARTFTVAQQAAAAVANGPAVSSNGGG